SLQRAMRQQTGLRGRLRPLRANCSSLLLKKQMACPGAGVLRTPPHVSAKDFKKKEARETRATGGTRCSQSLEISQSGLRKPFPRLLIWNSPLVHHRRLLLNIGRRDPNLVDSCSAAGHPTVFGLQGGGTIVNRDRFSLTVTLLQDLGIESQSSNQRE